MESNSRAIRLDRVIKELQNHIGNGWKALARALKFSKTDIDAIEYNNRENLREQIHEFFYQWKMREGNSATVSKLTDALVAAGLQGILDELKDVLPDDIRDETIPVQETCAPTSQTSPSSSQSEFVRQKRLERFSSSGSDKAVPGVASPERLVSRSVSTASSSSTVLEENEQTGHGATPLSSASSSVKVSLGSSPGPKAEVRKEFEVGDAVKVERGSSPPWYGGIRWIGEIPKVPALTAGIEMDTKVEGGHSGELNGVRYFTCQDGCGLFLPVSRLQRDDRFDDPPSLIRAPTPEGDEAEKDKKKSSTLPPLSVESLTLADEDVSASQSTASPPSSGHNILTFKCPGDQTGLIIGKGGKTIRGVESETNTIIKVLSSQFDPGANATVMIMGTEENRKKALFMLVRHVSERIALHTATTETIMIPSELCGRVIGRGGSTLKVIENVSGARIKIEERKGLDALLDPDGPRECKISGSAEQIENAKELIEMAQQGTDIVQAAQIAAHTIKLMKELIKMGFKFPEDVL